MFPIERRTIFISKLALRLTMAIVLVFPMRLFGAEAPVVLKQPSNRIEAIDAPREYLSRKFVDFVSDIDKFFGDERNYQEANNSVLQIDTTRVSGYNGDEKIVLSGRAKLHLPSTEKRLHLIVETDPDQNTSGETTQNTNTALNNKVTKPNSYGAALRFARAKESLWHFSADAGIKFQGIKLDPFTRVRGSYSVQVDPWRLKATETLFWFNTIGPGETTQFDAERFLSDPYLFRATSTVTWLKDIQRLDLRQDFSVFHTVSERTGLLYQGSIIGLRQPAYQVTDVVMLVTYRYRLHRQWVFFEMSPQLHFPKDKRHVYSPSFLMRLEILLDNSK